ncbi:hypothetical protein C8R45DRAFT_929402 [Mycena sanguinolenta]|nr:hypothetical protein C8R45DRAFT_929402 [Mycena sanguinolenta]
MIDLTQELRIPPPPQQRGKKESHIWHRTKLAERGAMQNTGKARREEVDRVVREQQSARKWKAEIARKMSQIVYGSAEVREFAGVVCVGISWQFGEESKLGVTARTATPELKKRGHCGNGQAMRRDASGCREHAAVETTWTLLSAKTAKWRCDMTDPLMWDRERHGACFLPPSTTRLAAAGYSDVQDASLHIRDLGDFIPTLPPLKCNLHFNSPKSSLDQPRCPLRFNSRVPLRRALLILATIAGDDSRARLGRVSMVGSAFSAAMKIWCFPSVEHGGTPQAEKRRITHHDGDNSRYKQRVQPFTSFLVFGPHYTRFLVWPSFLRFPLLAVHIN